MTSSSSGYVAVPRCPLTFDGTNYADFAAHMRVHMRGLRLWGVLCGEVPCPPRPLAPVAPVSPTPPPPLLHMLLLLPLPLHFSNGIIDLVIFVDLAYRP
jgi:hypothetical protein